MSISAPVGASVRPRPAVATPAAPPIRLRFVLLLGVLAWGVAALYPRMQAAFRLHDVTVATADYGLCMVGPTGPTLIRDRHSEFQKLVRRRLVATEASERPFQRCAKLARKVTQNIDVERLHTLTAVEFREYAGRGPSVTALGVSAAPLAGGSVDSPPSANSTVPSGAGISLCGESPEPAAAAGLGPSVSVIRVSLRRRDADLNAELTSRGRNRIAARCATARRDETIRQRPSHQSIPLPLPCPARRHRLHAQSRC